MASEPNQVIEVFFSYAHKDINLRDELEKHLTILKRHGYIKTWHDRKIVAGEDWEFEINKNLERANIVLLLISPDFLASDYCDGIEVKQALKRHDAGECCVIPIILRPVSWKDASFSKLQALPTNGKAVTEWKIRDKAFKDITEGIQKVIQEVSSSWVNENDPTLTVQEVKDAWEAVTRRTKRKSSGTLAAMLRLYEIIDVEGTPTQPVIVIESQIQAHYKYVNEEERYKVLEWALTIQFGLECRVRLLVPGTSQKEYKLPTLTEQEVNVVGGAVIIDGSTFSEQEWIDAWDAATINENDPTLTVQEVKDAWEAVTRRTRQKSSGTLAAMLRMSTIVDVEGTAAQPVIVIEFERRSHYKYVNEEEHYKVLEWALTIQFGLECRVRLVPPS